MLQSLLCLLFTLHLASAASVAVSTSAIVSTVTSTYLSTVSSVVSSSVSITTFGSCSPSTKSDGTVTSVCISGASATQVPVYNSSVVTITTKFVSTVGYSTIYSNVADPTTASTTPAPTPTPTSISYVVVPETVMITSVYTISADNGGVSTASVLTTLILETSTPTVLPTQTTHAGPTSTDLAGLTASSNPSSSNLTLSKDSIIKIAASVGAALGVMLVTCIAIFIIKRRRDRRPTRMSFEYDEPYGNANHMVMGKPDDGIVTVVKPIASTDSVWTHSPPSPPTAPLPPKSVIAVAPMPVPVARPSANLNVNTSATINPREMQEIGSFGIYGEPVSPPQSPISSKRTSQRVTEYGNVSEDSGSVYNQAYEVDGQSSQKAMDITDYRQDAYTREQSQQPNNTLYHEAQSNPRYELSARNSAFLQAQQFQRNNASGSQTYEAPDTTCHEAPSQTFHEQNDSPRYSVRGNAFSEVQRNARNSGHGAARFEMAAVPARQSVRTSYLPQNATRYRA